MNITETGLKRNFKFNNSGELSEALVSPDPFEQFEIWFTDVLKINPSEVYANAMFLATCSKEGIPSVRTVLLKEFNESGFVFYTNYLSRKGKDLKENPYASALFYWNELERQVRIEGKVEYVSREESDEYFHRRPFESQVAALSSMQSSVLKDRDMLLNKFDELKKKYENSIVPLPDFWGGYRLIPDKMEFWEGRQSRLHDRILYSRKNDEWKIERLAP